MQIPDISVIIPVFNEVENVETLAVSIVQALSNPPFGKTFEIIFIDDGSQDGTHRRLEALSRQDRRIKAVRLRRNYGQTAAIAAGFQMASGRIMVTMDGDLQNDPADIPTLVTKLEEGFDVVSGWRRDRKDHFVSRTLPSNIANRMISIVSGIALHDYGCTLKAYRAETAKALPLYGELHRLMPALAGIEGALITEVPVQHHPRLHGKSKYNLSKTFRVVLDVMTVLFLRRFITRPLHIFGGVGMVSFLAGFAICLYLAADKLLFGRTLADRPLLLLGVLLIVMGVQLFSTGIIAELQIRTYFESQRKPIYRVREMYGAWQSPGKDGIQAANRHEP